MKRLLSILLFFILAGAVEAQTYTPVPIVEGTAIPVKHTVDSLGNAYSFTDQSLIRTSASGDVTTIYFASAIIKYTGSNYHFTSVVVGPDDTIYAAATGSNSFSTGEVIVSGTVSGGFVQSDVPITNLTPYPRCDIDVDSHGNLYSISPVGSIIQITLPAGGGTAGYGVLAANYLFWQNDGAPAAPQQIAVSSDGHIYAQGFFPASTYYGWLELLPLGPLPTITVQPKSERLNINSSVQLSVVATAAQFITGYRWYRDGVAIPGASGRLTVTYTATQPGNYYVVVSTSAGSVTSDTATVILVTPDGTPVSALPTIIKPPADADLPYGGSATLTIDAAASETIRYQWFRDGTPIDGATGSSLRTTYAGTYYAVLTTSAGSVTSTSAKVQFLERLLNVSSRAQIGRASDSAVEGFVINGDSPAPKTILIRAVGPSLVDYGVIDVLANPVLSVYDAQGRLIATNRGWNNAPDVATAAAVAGAFPLKLDSKDAALTLSLPPGAYTAQVQGDNNSTGVALIEAYETQLDFNHLINLSTRARVGTGTNILVGGFVSAGAKPTRFLIRAVGPGLAGFGVSDVLQKPVLSVYDASGKLIAVNQGWSQVSSDQAVAVAAAATAAGAFKLTPGSDDCAVILTLPSGVYTAEVSGVNNTTGTALVEIYQVPESP